MSEAIPTPLDAVAHILRRVQKDPNLAWHMVGTESLRLCMDSYADDKGLNAEEFRKTIEANIRTMQKKQTSRIQELQKDIDHLQDELTSTEVSAEETQRESDKLWNSLDDLLNYCQLRGESPSIDAIRMAMNGKSLAHCLQCLEPVA